VADPPAAADAPKACAQRTITVPGDVTAKLRQRLYWGSDEWIAEYTRRTAVEGQFGNWKNPSAEAVKRGWVRIVGHVKTTLMLVLATAASNLRQLRKWAASTGDYTDPKTAPLPESLGFEEILPDGGVGATGPPTAA
jgi:DDE family transposase